MEVGLVCLLIQLERPLSEQPWDGECGVSIRGLWGTLVGCVRIMVLRLGKKMSFCLQRCSQKIFGMLGCLGLALEYFCEKKKKEAKMIKI